MTIYVVESEVGEPKIWGRGDAENFGEMLEDVYLGNGTVRRFDDAGGAKDEYPNSRLVQNIPSDGIEI